MNKIYEENDVNGLYKVIEKPNGRKIRLLRVPSKIYLDKISKIKEEEQLKRNKFEMKKKINKKIKAKQKELAINELLESGEITQEELNKLEDQ